MKRKLIGQVGVDSGQLMIVDPCYMNQWKTGTKPIGIKFWGRNEKEFAEYLTSKGVEVIYKSQGYRVMSDDEAYLTAIKRDAIGWSSLGQFVVTSFLTKDSYDEVSEITLSSEQAGNFDLGVAFSSGLGDGLYDVYATYEKLEGWGERISKVEVILITDEDRNPVDEEEDE